MLSLIIGRISYGIIAIFGITLSAAFSSADRQQGAGKKIAIFCACSLVIQVTCSVLFGMELTQMLYPLLVHLPLIIFLAKGFGVPWLVSLVSVFTAYQCCQILRVVTTIAYFFSSDAIWRNLLSILFAPFLYHLLRRIAAPALCGLMQRSRQTTLVLGIMPLIYYIFDYVGTVYTDLLYSGHPFMVQFMPSAMSLCYFFFLFSYQTSLEQQEKAQQERNLLALQLRRSESEFSAMQQMQEQARQYRHDLRHHFALLMGFAEEGDLASLKSYLIHNSESLDRFTPKTYCGNKVVNLLLSHFEEQAANYGVTLEVSAVLPEDIPFSDSELCSLLSNGLENAIRAAACVPQREKAVSVTLQVRQQNLLLSIQNPYVGEVSFRDGIPLSTDEGHGFGSRSIVSIVNKHSGQVSFSTQGDIFRLRIMLPMA